MIWLLANWKMVTAAALTFSISFLLHSLDVNRIEARDASNLAAAVSAQIDKCNADKKITQTVSHDYETAINSLSNQLRIIKLRKPSNCMPITGIAPRSNATSEPAINVGTYGLSTEWLYDFSAEGEQYRLQVVKLQDFINKTWDSNGATIKTQ